jgi:hypothetical protein
MSCAAHYVKGTCNPAHICVGNTAAEPAACAGTVCSAGKYCVGNDLYENKLCSASGTCAVDGAKIQGCVGPSSCCDYACANGACSGTVKPNDLWCAAQCLFVPSICKCY